MPVNVVGKADLYYLNIYAKKNRGACPADSLTYRAILRAYPEFCDLHPVFCVSFLVLRQASGNVHSFGCSFLYKFYKKLIFRRRSSAYAHFTIDK